jgi:hypothetical protein
MHLKIHSYSSVYNILAEITEKWVRPLASYFTNLEKMNLW